MKRILSLLCLLVMLSTVLQAKKKQQPVAPTWPDGTRMEAWFTDTTRIDVSQLGRQWLVTDYGVRGDDSLTVQTQALQRVIDRLLNGQSIALVTDAGTPGISDPGFLLVREAVRNGIEVETLPGATAFVPALVDSGIPCDRFIFLGFLPHKKGRQTAVRQLVQETRTMVIYESPYRLVKLLDELIEVLGEERQVSVSREISKIHAETARGTLREVRDHFAAKEVKGEIVVVLSGESSPEAETEKEISIN